MDLRQRSPGKLGTPAKMGFTGSTKVSAVWLWVNGRKHDSATGPAGAMRTGRPMVLEAHDLERRGREVEGGVGDFCGPNNERLRSLSRSRRPGSPPPELLTCESKLGAGFCK